MCGLGASCGRLAGGKTNIGGCAYRILYWISQEDEDAEDVLKT